MTLDSVTQKKMRRKIATVLLILIVAAPFIFTALTVVNSKDCTQIVIDTYEIHSGIDIPKIESINCYFDDKRDIRLSIYSFKGIIYLDKYLHDHKFEPVNLKELIFPFPLSREEMPKEDKLYAVSGTKWGREWRYIVERESNRLWVEIKYN
jgi:hypothetical protein